MGYQEEFASSDAAVGSYVCHLTIATSALTLRPGGPGTYVPPAAGSHGQPGQAAFLGQPSVGPEVLTPFVPIAMDAIITAAGPVLAPLVAVAATGAVAIAAVLGLILLTTTPAHAPGLPMPVVSRNELRLRELVAKQAAGTLTKDEEAELIALLAEVKGIHIEKLEDLALTSPISDPDEAFNRLWDQHGPPDLRQLDLQQTLDHVEYRDYSVPRANGIGGAHNASEFSKHQADYTEISRVPHPTIPGVEQVEYQISALDKALKPTGILKAEIYQKTLYDPKVWPRPRLERALKEALLDARTRSGGALQNGWWYGTTQRGDTITGTYRNGKISTFFFK